MQFLSNIMLEALGFFAYFGGYGWGIIWLTIAVNLALYPLTLSSIKSMAAMQKIQPKIKELQAKHKDSPKELQKETMGLYKGEGVNPMGGCLPVLLKIPFFLALFWAFQSSAFLGVASNPENSTSFLWISGRVGAGAFHSEKLVEKLETAKIITRDKKASKKAKEKKFVWNAALKIGEKDDLNKLLKGAEEDSAKDNKKILEALKIKVKNLTSEDVAVLLTAWNNTNSLAKPDRIETPFGKISLFALLIGITTFLMQKTMPNAAGGQMQMMIMIMPMFIVFISWNFPVGVQLYWLVSNAMGAAQQYYITKKTNATVPKIKEEVK
jgi:YidC/Oxa1 family membrane protein insertase